jgi:hypothetical protein
VESCGGLQFAIVSVGGQKQENAEQESESVLYRNELVTDPVHGSDEDGTLRIGFNFLPEFCNAIVHSAISRSLSFWPRGADELLARDDNFWSGHKKLQNFELSDSQDDRLIGSVEFHGAEVKTKVSKVRHLMWFSTLEIVHVLDWRLMRNKGRV